MLMLSFAAIYAMMMLPLAATRRFLHGCCCFFLRLRYAITLPAAMSLLYYCRRCGIAAAFRYHTAYHCHAAVIAAARPPAADIRLALFSPLMILRQLSLMRFAEPAGHADAARAVTIAFAADAASRGQPRYWHYLLPLHIISAAD